MGVVGYPGRLISQETRCKITLQFEIVPRNPSIFSQAQRDRPHQNRGGHVDDRKLWFDLQADGNNIVHSSRAKQCLIDFGTSDLSASGKPQLKKQYPKVCFRTYHKQSRTPGLLDMATPGQQPSHACTTSAPYFPDALLCHNLNKPPTPTSDLLLRNLITPSRRKSLQIGNQK